MENNAVETSDVNEQSQPNVEEQEFKPQDNLPSPSISSSTSNENTLGLYSLGTSTFNGNYVEMSGTSTRSSLTTNRNNVANTSCIDTNNIASSSQNESFQNNYAEGVTNYITCNMDQITKPHSLSHLSRLISTKNNQPETANTVTKPPNYTYKHSYTISNFCSPVTASPYKAVGGPIKPSTSHNSTRSSVNLEVCDTCNRFTLIIECSQCRMNACESCLSIGMHTHNVLSVRPTVHEEKCSEHPTHLALFICKTHNQHICMICQIDFLGKHSNCRNEIIMKTNENKDISDSNQLFRLESSFNLFPNATTPNRIPTRLVQASVTDVPHLQNCDLVGPGTKVAVVNQEGILYLVVKNISGAPCKYGEFLFDVVAKEYHVNGKKLPISTKAHFQNGVIEIRYKFSNPGTHLILTRVNSQEISNTPLSIFVHLDSKFQQRMQLKGHISLDIAPINSPRAICSDKNGNIYVADGCSNMIHKIAQNNEVSVILTCFNVPSAIAVDNNGDIAVCDAERNCVIVYDNNGIIIKSSLITHGIKCPSAIAVDSQNRFVIIHSKSRLIRLSNNMKESEEMSLQIDSNQIVPSGICIGYLDEILITDKTKSEVFVVNVETKQTLSKFTLSCSPYLKQISGIAMDADGYLIILDNLNGRVEVYTYGGKFICFTAQCHKPEKIACSVRSYGIPTSKYLIVEKRTEDFALVHFEIS